MALSRIQMEEVINAGGFVLYKGRIISDVDDLPTQDELDAVGGGDIDFTPVVTASNAVRDRLPAALDDVDGGLKVHVQNPSEGGASGGAVTVADGDDAALGSTADDDTTLTVIGRLKKLVALLSGVLSVNVENFPGTVAVSNLPATQPVSGTVAVSNQPTTMASTVANGADVALGATTDTSAASTVIGRLKALIALIPAALGANGGMKVDIVGNTAGVGGGSVPAPTVVFAAASRSATITSSEISGTGYKGIRVRLTKTDSAGVSVAVRFYAKMADGSFTQIATGGNTTSGSPGHSELFIYPGAIAATGSASSSLTTYPSPTVLNNFVPDAFKVEIFYPSATAATCVVDYQLLP